MIDQMIFFIWNKAKSVLSIKLLILYYVSTLTNHELIINIIRKRIRYKLKIYIYIYISISLQSLELRVDNVF